MKKIALVTGGTRGIGAEIAKCLRDAGYFVAANYNCNHDAARAFQEETAIPIFSWDITDFTACERGVRDVCSFFGGSVDVLVNNAGVTRDVMLHKMDPNDWSWVIATDLTSVFNMSRVVIGSMREKSFGRIINISSVNGLKGQVGQTNYAAAKAGVLGFTKALALESATKGITVNAIAPGYVSTDMTDAIKSDIKEKIVATIPIGRFGKTKEVADSVLFLASEEASFITGITLSVNGGQYL
jgi:acetoacetyl-CoA reductase